jgi:hypothetical protein
MRRKIQQEVSRLKIKIKAMPETDCGDATGGIDTSDGGRRDRENCGGDDDAEETLKQRERPSGLAYKLRHAAARATVRRYIGRKADQLE